MSVIISFLINLVAILGLLAVSAFLATVIIAFIGLIIATCKGDDV